MSETQNQANNDQSVEVKGLPRAQGRITPAIPSAIDTTKVIDFKSQLEKVGKIQIKPFINGLKENMGLENYGMVLFPGTAYMEQLAALEINGVVKYINGLDEYSAVVQNISDPEKKAAVILNIRTVVAYLEKMLATNIVNPSDEDFWANVKLLRPDNDKFWSGIEIKATNEPVFLQPATDPFDLIKFYAIEAGGFSGIAKSYEDALAAPVPPKFYLDKEKVSIVVKTDYKRLRNTAITLLDKIAKSEPKKLLYIAKILDASSASYKNSTPVDVLYDVLDEYIAGNGVESNKTKSANNFISTANETVGDLKIRAMVKDAVFFKIISPKPDGQFYHSKTLAMMGRNISDIIIYLKNPINEDILMSTLAEVEKFWNL